MKNLKKKSRKAKNLGLADQQKGSKSYRFMSGQIRNLVSLASILKDRITSIFSKRSLSAVMNGVRSALWSLKRIFLVIFFVRIMPLRVHRIVHKFDAYHSGEVVDAISWQARDQRFESSLSPIFLIDKIRPRLFF